MKKILSLLRPHLLSLSLQSMTVRRGEDLPIPKERDVSPIDDPLDHPDIQGCHLQRGDYPTITRRSLEYPSLFTPRHHE